MSSGEPTRVAFCITDLDPGGAEKALVRLVTGLDRRRWKPTVYSLSRRGRLADELEQSGIRVVSLGAGGWWNVLVVVRLIGQLRRERPALVQTYLYHANIVGRIAARLAGVRHVVSGIRVAEKRSRLRLQIDRMTDFLVERHVCVSRSVAEFSIREGGLPAEKVVVIPNGVDAQRFSSAAPADLTEFGIPPDARTLLFVGRLDRQKGPDVLLEAVRPLLQSKRNVHLLMVGDGPLREELAKTARNDGLASTVHFAGRRGNVAELMKAAFCLVLPSRWEGLPNVVLEAMAAGLPVVASRVEGTAELLRDGTLGVLVEPERPEALRNAIARLVENPAAALRLAESSQAYVLKDLTWGAMVAEYDQLYTGLLAE